MNLKNIFVIFLFLISVSRNKTQEILSLNQTTFFEALKTHPLIVILFYSSWSFSFSNVDAELAIVQTSLALKNISIAFAKIEVKQSNQKIGKLFNFSILSEIKFFQNQELTGSLSAELKSEYIEEWILKKMEPSLIEIFSPEDLKNFTSRHKLTLLYLGEPPGLFKKISDDHVDVFFIYSKNEDLLRLFPQKILLFKSHKPTPITFEGELNESLSDFLEDNRYDDIIVMTFKTKKRVFTAEENILYLFLNNDEPEEEAEIYENFTKFSLKYHDKFLAVLYNGYQEPVMEYFLTDLGVRKQSMPCIRFSKFNENDAESHPDIYFYPSTSFSLENLERFFEDIQEKKIKPKEAAQPKENPEIKQDDDSKVKYIRKSAFEQVVYDPEKDVVVLFFEPSDELCQKFNRIYERTAKTLSSNERILFVKIDVGKGKIGKLKIEEVPTVYFFRADDKEKYFEYEGDEKVRSVVEWIKKHSSFPWEKEDL